MREFRGGARFSEKLLAHIGCLGLLRRQHFDGHGTIQGNLAGEIHHTHPAPADLPFQRIAAGKGHLQLHQLDRKWLVHQVYLGPHVSSVLKRHNVLPLPDSFSGVGSRRGPDGNHVGGIKARTHRSDQTANSFPLGSLK